MRRSAWLIPCFLVLHSPDGTPLWYRAESIQEVKPVKHQHREQFAKSTNSVVYASDGPQGVSEPAEFVMERIARCGKGITLPPN